MIPLRDYNRTGTIPVFVVLLFMANVLVFIWQARQPPKAMQEYLVSEGGLVPARV